MSCVFVLKGEEIIIIKVKMIKLMCLTFNKKNIVMFFTRKNKNTKHKQSIAF